MTESTRTGKTRSHSVNNNSQKKEFHTINLSPVPSTEQAQASDSCLFYAFLDEDERVLTCKDAGLANPGKAENLRYRRYCFDCIAKDTFDKAVPFLWSVDPLNRSLVVERMREHDRIFLDATRSEGLSHHLRLYWAGISKTAKKLKMTLAQKHGWCILKLEPKQKRKPKVLWFSADPASDPEAELAARNGNAVQFKFVRSPNEDELQRLQEVVSLRHVPDVDFWTPPSTSEFGTDTPPVHVEGKEDKEEEEGGEVESKAPLPSKPKSGTTNPTVPVEGKDQAPPNSSPPETPGEPSFNLRKEDLDPLQRKRSELTADERRRSWLIAAAEAA